MSMDTINFDAYVELVFDKDIYCSLARMMDNRKRKE